VLAKTISSILPGAGDFSLVVARFYLFLIYSGVYGASSVSTLLAST
jgi:hypothetical protein